jgi:hypothetical protein
MPHFNPSTLNLVVRDFGVHLLETVKEQLVAALPEHSEKVVAVLSALQAEVSVELTPVKGKKGRGKAAASGVPVPKRAPSAYNLFMADKMRALGADKDNKSLSKSELMKKVAAMWKDEKAKALADAPASASVPASASASVPASASAPSK